MLNSIFKKGDNRIVPSGTGALNQPSSCRLVCLQHLEGANSDPSDKGNPSSKDNYFDKGNPLSASFIF